MYIISLIITSIVFILIEFTYYFVETIFLNKQIIQEDRLLENKEKEEIKAKEYIETSDNDLEDIWEIIIPKIKLKAPISEGTSQDVMRYYVGHFENTEFIYGNVGLAAHNRGFPINYFARLKELKIDDEIIYKTKYGEKKYKVTLSTIIEDTNWSYLLQDTDKNTLTLITCVENRPQKRRCIRAEEYK